MNRIAMTLALSLLGACDTGTQMGAQADLRTIPDMRTGPGNVAVGVACQTVERPCPTDPKTMAAARCATIVDLDHFGACAPRCDPNNKVLVDTAVGVYERWPDCDTVQPGDVKCVNMGAGGAECVIICDRKKLLGRECPQGWSCVASQGFYLCRPPQT